MTAARRLAAILAADVVGYSRLMGEDEAGTALSVREHREAARPLARKGMRNSHNADPRICKFSSSSPSCYRPDKRELSPCYPPVILPLSCSLHA